MAKIRSNLISGFPKSGYQSICNCFDIHNYCPDIETCSDYRTFCPHFIKCFDYQTCYALISGFLIFDYQTFMPQYPDLYASISGLLVRISKHLDIKTCNFMFRNPDIRQLVYHYICKMKIQMFIELTPGEQLDRISRLLSHPVRKKYLNKKTA